MAAVSQYLLNLMISNDLAILIWLVILAISFLIDKKWKLGTALCAFAIAAAVGPSAMLGEGEVGLTGFVLAFAAIQRRIEVRLEDLIIAYWIVRWLLNSALRAGRPLNRKTLFNFFLLYILSIFAGAVVYMIKFGTESYFPWLYFVKYLEYFLVFLYVSNHIRDEKHARGLLRLMLVLAIPVGGWAVCQVAAGTTFASDGSYRAVLPFHDGPGPLSEYTLMLIPLALFGGIVGKLISNRLAYLASLLLVLALFAAGSRLAMAGLLVAVGLGSLWFSRKALVAFVSGLGVMVGILFAFPKLAPESLVVRVLDFSTMYGNPNSSAAQRLDIWRTAIYTWSKDPILGVGLTGFPVADNYYIRMLVELGVVGLLIFLLCLVQFGWTGIKVYQGGRSAESRLFKAIGVSYLCTMLAILIYAVSLDAFQPIRDMNILWYYTGIMFALGPMLKRRSQILQQAPRPVPRSMVHAPSPLRLPS